MTRSLASTAIRSFSAVGAALVLGGCRGTTDPHSPPVACTLVAVSAVSVYVKDAGTGASIASGSTLVLRDGTFADSTTVPASHPELDAVPIATPGTYERVGTYEVTVRKPGYASMSWSGVVVTKDECHVRPVVLTAQLARA